MKNRCPTRAVRSREKVKYHTKIFLLLVVYLIVFQQMNATGVFSGMLVSAQGFLLAVESESIHEGDEATLVLTRLTEEAEEIEIALPDSMTLNFDKSKENFSDTTELSYDEETNHLKVSYEVGDSDKEVKLFISCEVAGTYVISITATNEVLEELEIVVNEVEGDEGLTGNEERVMEGEEPKGNEEQAVEVEEPEGKEEQAVEGEDLGKSDGQVIEGEESEGKEEQAVEGEDLGKSDGQVIEEESGGNEEQVVEGEEPRGNEEQALEGAGAVVTNSEGIVADPFAGSVVDGVARVYNTKEYMDAISNISVHTILVEQDFVMDEGENISVTGSNNSNLHWNKGSGESYHDYAIGYTRDLVIDGQGHTVDFRDVGTYFAGTTSKPMNLTVKNFVAYGRNFWGPWRLRDKGTMVVENVEYYGAQLTSSSSGDLIFGGNIRIEQQLQYESPFDKKLHNTQANNQANLEATNLTIKAGTKYFGKTVNAGAWHLRSGGAVTIHEDAVIDLYAPDTGGEANGNAIYVEGSLTVKDGAQLNIYNDALTANARPAIELGSNASVYVGTGAKVNVDINGVLVTNAGVQMGTNSSFIVEDGAEFHMILRNQKASTQDAIHGTGKNTFKIGRGATFDVRMDGTGWRDIIEFAGSGNTFEFKDAKRVNLQMDNTYRDNRLIRMSGQLRVDVQKVSAWTTNTWSSGGDDNATYSWTPIYGMIATYGGANVSSVTANSLTTAVATDFTNKFKSINASSPGTRRLLFEHIPDVEISLNELTNNTSKTNSYTITGVASPGAYIYLSGNDHIPAGTIPAQADGDARLYHVIADKDGNFSFTLTEGNYFTAGETITAYAFLNGKDATASTIVLDEVAPDPPILDDPLTVDSTDFTGTAEANSTVTIYKDGVVVATGSADASGHFEIAVPPGMILVPGDKYYATSTDAVGNESEKSNIVIVVGDGFLSLHVPATLSFGSANELPYQSSRIYREEPDWAIQVTDTRYAKSEWQLTARLMRDFTAANDATLEDLLVFATGAEESTENPLSSTRIVIDQDTLAPGETTKNISWDAEEGLILRLLPGEAQATMYDGTVEWTLGDVPGNSGE